MYIYIKTTEICMQKYSITRDSPRSHSHTAAPPPLVTIQASKIVTGFLRFEGLMILKLLTSSLSFSSLTYSRDGTTLNQTTLSVLTFVAQTHGRTEAHREQWWRRAEHCSGVISKFQLTRPSQVTGFIGRKAVIATCLVPFTIY